MRITSKGRYGLKAMIELYRADGILKNREIAAAHDIPSKYLEQIINTLKKSGLVLSVRGADGGYKLSRPAEEISLYDILISLEGNLSVMDSGQEKNPAGFEAFWSDVDKSISKILEISLADFAKKADKKGEYRAAV